MLSLFLSQGIVVCTVISGLWNQVKPPLRILKILRILRILFPGLWNSGELWFSPTLQHNPKAHFAQKAGSKG